MTPSASRVPQSLRRAVLVAALLVPAVSVSLTPLARAQDDLPAPAAATSDTTPTTATDQPTPENAARASGLVSQAFTLANGDPMARSTAVRGAAALLARLPQADRDKLYTRWLTLALSPSVPRGLRLSALSSFFDVAARADATFARQKALQLPDAAGRAGAFLQLSRADYPADFFAADADSQRALRAARQETSPRIRARALTFVALYISALNPTTRRAAVTEASSAVRSLPPGHDRDTLLAEVVGAASKFDLALARSIAGAIVDEKLRGLADARVNLSEVSQTTLTVSSQDRISALAQAAAPYDMRAIPILLDLPPQEAVLKSLGAALPPISPGATPSVDISLLERIWDFASRLEPSVYRDQLQSRLARLMTLQDPARGRQWGKRLAWKGGRIQVGAFLKQVLQIRVASALASRHSPASAQAKLAALPDLSDRSLNAALAQSKTLPAPARVEALLLIAGQLLA